MTTKGTLIGFGHRAQVGKDTAACALDLDRHHFAKAIRDLAWHLNPYLPEVNDTIGVLVRKYGWESAKTQFPCVRQYLQDLGAGARTHLGDDVWITRLLATVDSARRRGRSVGIPDVRYPNEAEAIRAAGGILVRIDRDDVERLDHPTECALDDWSDWDHVIENNGTYDEFVDAVRAQLRGS